MIDSRRNPNPTGPAIKKPSSSGPRCAMERAIRTIVSRSTGSRRWKLNWPAMPHIVLVQRSEVRGQKSEVRGQKSTLTSNSNEYLRVIMQIKSAKDLTVYKRAYELAMEIFHASKHFPAEERYSLTDQLRRSSRSVWSNLREAWAKRRYEAHFVSKLTDSDGENGETDTWLDLARDCGYVSKEDHAFFVEQCQEVGAMLGSMINNPSSFILTPTSDR